MYCFRHSHVYGGQLGVGAWAWGMGGGHMCGVTVCFCLLFLLLPFVCLLSRAWSFGFSCLEKLYTPLSTSST
jgi:hypothetical protein